MVISEKYKFIFVRVPKNASTSLASFFVKNCCNKNDRYTAINDAGISTTNVPASVIDKYRHQYRFIHLTIDEMLENGIINKDELLSKDVIGVIRNPLDRQLSSFFFLNRTGDKSVENFRKQYANGYHMNDISNRILQSEYIGDTGVYWAYENLGAELQEFINQKGIPVTELLKSYKSQFRKRDDSLVDIYYDSKTRNAVETYFEKDFELYENAINNRPRTYYSPVAG